MGRRILKQFLTFSMLIGYKIINLLLAVIEDFLIIAGLAFINVASYTLSQTVGLFVTGFTLLALGVYFAINPIKRG